jgi:hypothetical protein
MVMDREVHHVPDVGVARIRNHPISERCRLD